MVLLCMLTPYQEAAEIESRSLNTLILSLGFIKRTNAFA
jgi:hypothetical protein